ncbi:hypothetical protein HQ571_06195 [Candidatus Kuenenbacteria bacterium]|nr:hypothetical protein [Candidatus Kuenenbacteria bacterium]
MKNDKDNFILIAVAAIFIGGLVIYGWNFINGKDLSRPPEFDLSVYDDTSWLTGDESNKAKQGEIGQQDKADLETGYIYFKDSFQLSSVEQTNKFIKVFLQDFEGLENLPIENLNNNIVQNDFTYIARVEYRGVEGFDKTIEMLMNEYNDVVLVK